MLIPLHNIAQGMGSNIQITAPRPVLTANPEATLEDLYQEFVAPTEARRAQPSLTRRVMRESVRRVFGQCDLFDLGLESNYHLQVRGRPIVDFETEPRPASRSARPLAWAYVNMSSMET